MRRDLDGSEGAYKGTDRLQAGQGRFDGESIGVEDSFHLVYNGP